MPIASSDIPQAGIPLLQHLLDTYASECNKTESVWSCFSDADLEYKPHAKSSTVFEILKHQLLSERRFFAEFLGVSEPPAPDVLPKQATLNGFRERFMELARPRLVHLATQPESWWVEQVPFFDVQRQRIWIFWRRVLHSAHHRTQLTQYLRLVERPVPSTYGPTADVTWSGADPTTSVEAAARKQ